MSKWIPLLKTGTFTDMHNKAYTITQDVIDRLAKNYDPNKPAHMVVGHPQKAKVPSFGLVESLKAVGDTLFFRPAKVVAEFAALVKKGGFPAVSAGLDIGLNALDHIAFLSAERPAVEGFAPICEFSSAQESECVSLSVESVTEGHLAEFGYPESRIGWRINDIGRMFRAIKNSLIEKDGLESADKVLPDYMIENLAESIPSPETQAAFKHPSTGGQMDFELLLNEEKAKTAELTTKLAEFSASAETQTAELDRIKAENSALTAALATVETDKRKAEFCAFVETLIADRRVLPDQKEATVAMLETMHQSTPANFSASSGEKSPLDLYKADLESRPQIAPATGESGVKGPEFGAGSGSDPVALGIKARAYIDEQEAKGVKVSVFEAVEHVKVS